VFILYLMDRRARASRPDYLADGCARLGAPGARTAALQLGGGRAVRPKVCRRTRLPAAHAALGTLDGPDDAIETYWNWTLLHALGASDSVLELYRKAQEGTGISTENSARSLPNWPLTAAGSSSRSPTGFTRARECAPSCCSAVGPNDDSTASAACVSPPCTWARTRRLRTTTREPRDPEPVERQQGTDAAQGDHLRLGWRPRPGHSTSCTTGRPRQVARPSGALPENALALRRVSRQRRRQLLNLAATILGLNAYMLTGEEKYRKWVLDYVDAWKERTELTGGNVPSNVGRNGKPGGEHNGQWWKGTYGWNFTIFDGELGQIATATISRLARGPDSATRCC